jgi:hypothetical protein
LSDEDAESAPRSRDRWRFAEFRSVVDSFKQALAWAAVSQLEFRQRAAIGNSQSLDQFP